MCGTGGTRRDSAMCAAADVSIALAVAMGEVERALTLILHSLIHNLPLLSKKLYQNCTKTVYFILIQCRAHFITCAQGLLLCYA